MSEDTTHESPFHQRIFAVRDAKAEMYLHPVPSQTVSTAIRQFRDAAQDEKSQFFLHPEDFALYWIGSFDQETGHLIPMTPIQVAHALDFAGGENGSLGNPS